MKKDKQKKGIPFAALRKGIVGGLVGLTMIAGGGLLTGCGKDGAPGATGAQGPAGSDGATWYSGIAYSNAQGKVGDFFYDTDDFKIYHKTASGWEFLSYIRGEDGDDGDDGATWFSGTAVAGSGDNIFATVVDAKIGDMYFNTTNNSVYKCVGENTWKWISNVQGATGATGSSWLTGIIAPTEDTGKDGDTYLDIVTNYVYTKTNGVWTKIGELSGDRDITINQQVSPWKGKSAVFVGDSITYGSGCDGDKYWEVLEDEIGFSSVTGMGIGGSCWSVKSDYGTANQPLINRWQQIPEADLIQIFMGTNDYGHGTPLGAIEDDTDVSFYGAMNYILSNLQKKYPESRIVVCTPLHRYGRNASANILTYDYLPHPVTGKTLGDYVDAMKDVCERLSIPVIDLFNISGINPTIEEVKAKYMPDGLHPNTEGHKLIANIMKNHLNLYATSESKPEVTPNYEFEIVHGNKFSTDAATASNTTRATLSKNIYLEKDTVVSVKNTELYEVAVYKQTSETITTGSSISGGFKDTYTVTESGYYGFVFAKKDTSSFNFSTDSKEFYDYVTVTTPVAERELVIGNQFGSGATLTDNTRATLAKNIYIESPITISTKDSANFEVAVYSQNGETITASSSISGGYVASYQITEPGWYGFALKNINGTFDFNSMSKTFDDYVTFNNFVSVSLDGITVETGSKYAAGYETNTARASSNINVYLRAGTILSVKDTATYAFAVYRQTGLTTINNSTNSLTNGWNDITYTIQENGFYGIALKRIDAVAFDFTNVDSTTLSDYVDAKIDSSLIPEYSTLDDVTLVLGNKYDANFLTNNTRASGNVNLYLKAGTVISLKDSDYKYGVFTQNSEEVSLDGSTCIQVWTAEDFTIDADGWYGIAVKRVDEGSFDFSTDSINVSDYVELVIE